jgi:hypothetical protein
MKMPAQVETRPTRSAPRRFNQVAPQITASFTAHSATGESPGANQARYCANSTG